MIQVGDTGTYTTPNGYELYVTVTGIGEEKRDKEGRTWTPVNVFFLPYGGRGVLSASAIKFDK